MTILGFIAFHYSSPLDIAQYVSYMIDIKERPVEGTMDRINYLKDNYNSFGIIDKLIAELRSESINLEENVLDHYIEGVVNDFYSQLIDEFYPHESFHFVLLNSIEHEGLNQIVNTEFTILDQREGCIHFQSDNSIRSIQILSQLEELIIMYPLSENRLYTLVLHGSTGEKVYYTVLVDPDYPITLQKIEQSNGRR